MKTCTVCGSQIPEGRIKALPNTKTCVEHSTAQKFSLNVIQHGELEDDGFQEMEIIRDQRTLERLMEYKKQLGSYK